MSHYLLNIVYRSYFPTYDLCTVIFRRAYSTSYFQTGYFHRGICPRCPAIVTALHAIKADKKRKHADNFLRCKIDYGWYFRRIVNFM